jgi:hypothetical protein
MNPWTLGENETLEVLFTHVHTVLRRGQTMSLFTTSHAWSLNNLLCESSAFKNWLRAAEQRRLKDHKKKGTCVLFKGRTLSCLIATTDCTNFFSKVVFATVPGSSVNSWDSWFIFNLRKINTCYYTDTDTDTYRTMYILNVDFPGSKLEEGLSISLQ